MEQAHPRSRGENLRAVHLNPCEQGSSPLTRGKHQGQGRGLLCFGLIPAHAGKTTTSLSEVSGARAHPRSRGENALHLHVRCCERGSSPLTRGKPARRRPRTAGRGLIPAHAGKTSSRSIRRSSTTAHPRSRGENARIALLPAISLGSSPLTRGKRMCHFWNTFRFGLIPAHAGKTCPIRIAPIHPRAHPRSRGENQPRCYYARGSLGSSPLTRGKLRCVCV